MPAFSGKSLDVEFRWLRWRPPTDHPEKTKTSAVTAKPEVQRKRRKQDLQSFEGSHFANPQKHIPIKARTSRSFQWADFIDLGSQANTEKGIINPKIKLLLRIKYSS